MDVNRTYNPDAVATVQVDANRMEDAVRVLTANGFARFEVVAPEGGRLFSSQTKGFAELEFRDKQDAEVAWRFLKDQGFEAILTNW
jgi:hypothetical protein